MFIFHRALQDRPPLHQLRRLLRPLLVPLLSTVNAVAKAGPVRRHVSRLTHATLSMVCLLPRVDRVRTYKLIILKPQITTRSATKQYLTLVRCIVTEENYFIDVQSECSVLRMHKLHDERLLLQSI